MFQNVSMTFNQLRTLAGQAAVALAGAGVRPGDAVLFILPNTPHFPLSYFGTVRLGAAVAAVPPTSTPREMDFYIRDSGARVIITLDLLYEKIADVWEAAGVEKVIVGTVADFLPFHLRLLGRLTHKIPAPAAPIRFGERVIPMPRFLSSGKGKEIPEAATPDAVAVLQYTGGTTGSPKAAMLTHASLLANARQMIVWFPVVKVAKETILAVLPLFHVYGMTLVMNAGLLLAARTILMPTWNPADVFDTIRRHRPSIFPGVPTLYVAFINDERSRTYDVSSIDVCVCGGAPLPAEVKQGFERLTHGHLYEGYGLSEASPVVAAHAHDERGEPGSIGLPLPNTVIQLVDEAAQPVPVGEPGEVLVRGPQVMVGYWRRPEETAEVLRGGWLHTGDIARMHEKGFFFIVDRKKDLIITGGENIYPREIEEVLYEHPKVKEAAVVGVPHPFGGEVAKAFIVLKEGEHATKPEMKSFAMERLAKHKVPRAFEFRQELPKSSTGKILKRVLADEERAKAASRRRLGEAGTD